MTVRDQIAIEAMKSIILTPDKYGGNAETIAKLSYKMADEMVRMKLSQ